MKPAKVLEHFANRRPCAPGIEVCTGARTIGHHWARLGTVWARFGRAQPWPGVTACASIHGKAARPLVAGRKTGATDARAIWLAVQQPGTNEVGWPK
ncbi:hypothetical protein D8B34_04725 [Verminephrobacter eiseniae]|nr:hypothetical protein [Verminephrobacter eiseniae]MCW5294386.1 hypothetical protein [Verminephrobacter eiseniae]MCW8183958.1 hypothetical protein [Verminephrobacter eiseniae]MCW8222496.1 hypothetical protein [Verminephrobacter eiseniae]MCW8233120.1 hypothetical protein [Verminephrobacter eiseniae]